MTDLWAKVGLSCALYLLGAYIYAKRFPECLWPRLMVAPAFLGASHVWRCGYGDGKSYRAAQRLRPRHSGETQRLP